jgi:hypothetical protein
MSLDEWRAWWDRHGERELRCMLMTAWDPIGVGYEPNAWDEYDDYAFTIARRLYEASNENAAREQVAAVLDDVEADLGSSSEASKRKNFRLALAIVAWHEWSFVRGGSTTAPDVAEG